MTPTVEQVKDLAAFLLGDPNHRKFTYEGLQPAFSVAYDEMYSHMLKYQVNAIKLVVVYALPASTTSLLPATAGIPNFGELISLEERPTGSTENYVDVHEVGQLPQRDQDGNRLGEYEWRGETFYFVGTNSGVDLRFTYWSSGAAPESGSTGVDGSLNFLAYRTAAVAGPPKGYVELAKEKDLEARGSKLDGSGGYLHDLLQPMVRSANKVPLQPPAFRAGGRRVSLGGRPPTW